jgi:hypothetical protein
MTDGVSAVGRGTRELIAFQSRRMGSVARIFRAFDACGHPNLNSGILSAGELDRPMASASGHHQDRFRDVL